jgi:hypothetical protein
MAMIVFVNYVLAPIIVIVGVSVVVFAVAYRICNPIPEDDPNDHWDLS